MPAHDPARRSAVARIAVIERHNGPDDPRLPGLRRDLVAAELEERIRKAAETAPPLTDSQRLRLAALLVGGAR